MELWNKARAITDIGLGAHYFSLSLFCLILSYFVAPRVEALKKFSSFFAKMKIWAWSLLAALIYSGLYLRLFKYLIGRLRPNKTPHHDPALFFPFNSDWNYQSFPSGHSQVLFCVATMVALIDHRRRWLWFGLATFVAFTRVVIYAHFLSDVIGGATLGFLGALWASHLMQKYSRFKLSP